MPLVTSEWLVYELPLDKAQTKDSFLYKLVDKSENVLIVFSILYQLFLRIYKIFNNCYYDVYDFSLVKCYELQL